MRKNVNISVVIPTYNRGKLLEEALQSVFAQEVQPMEIIVVDDGSSEDIKMHIAAATAKSGGVDVRYTRVDGVGPGVARNTGVQLARGEFISFIDSDDIWPSWTISTILDALDRNRAANDPIIYLNAQTFSGESRIHLSRRETLECAVFESVLAGDHKISVATSRLGLVSKELFLRCGGFWDHKWNSEDTDFALRAGLACPFVFIKRPICVDQRVHPGQISVSYDRFEAGIRALITRERSGDYPGGRMHEQARLRWISYHTRSCCWHLASSGRRSRALFLYWEIFGWNLRLNRWPFLFLFPVVCAAWALFGIKKRYTGIRLRWLGSC